MTMSEMLPQPGTEPEPIAQQPDDAVGQKSPESQEKKPLTQEELRQVRLYGGVEQFNNAIATYQKYVALLNEGGMDKDNERHADWEAAQQKAMETLGGVAQSLGAYAQNRKVPTKRLCDFLNDNSCYTYDKKDSKEILEDKILSIVLDQNTYRIQKHDEILNELGKYLKKDSEERLVDIQKILKRKDKHHLSFNSLLLTRFEPVTQEEVDTAVAAEEVRTTQMAGGKQKEDDRKNNGGNTVEMLSPHEQAIKTARDVYVTEYKQWLGAKKDKRNVSRLARLEAGADVAYKNYLAVVDEQTKEEYREKIENRSKEEQKLVRCDLYRKYVVDEENILARAKVENWPPKEKTIFRKALEQWSRIPKPARWAISAAVTTGIALGVGGVTFGGGLALFGYKFGRAALSTFSVLGTERLAAIGLKKLKTNYVEGAQYIDTHNESIINDFNGARERYREALELKAKQERRHNIAKFLLAGAVGIAVTGVANAMEHSLGFESGASITKTPEDAPPSGGSGASVAHLSSADQQQFEDYSDQLMRAKKVATDKILQAEETRLRLINLRLAKEAATLAAEQEKTAEHLAELATVQKGEGVWQAVYRQYKDQLEANPKSFGVTNIDDAEEVRRVLNHETATFLHENHLIAEKGGETFVTPGTKVFIEPDGTAQIDGDVQLRWQQGKLVSSEDAWKAVAPHADEFEAERMPLGHVDSRHLIYGPEEDTVPRASHSAEDAIERYGQKQQLETIPAMYMKPEDAFKEIADQTRITGEMNTIFDQNSLYVQENVYRAVSENAQRRLEYMASRGIDLFSHREATEGLSDAIHDMQSTYEHTRDMFYKTIERMGLDMRDYREAIFEKKVTVAMLFDTPEASLADPFKPLVKMVRDYEPHGGECAMLVDDFLKSRFVLQ